MLYLAAVLILGFFGLYVYIWKRVNREWVKHNGEVIEADITDAVCRKRGNWGVTWELHAQWYRPADGKLFAFKEGEWLRKDPTEFLTAEGIRQVTVRIDPKDPHTHWVVLDFLPADY
ncbi:MAG: hypothetical protein KF690_10095, partial [Bacteroidetes bacterium]|nr:hypothetical protein [Bacteroidota bacterium]